MNASPLQTHNRFASLQVEDTMNYAQPAVDTSPVQVLPLRNATIFTSPMPDAMTLPTHHRLRKVDTKDEFKLDVQVSQQQALHDLHTLIDSGATMNFIHIKVVQNLRLTITPLNKSISVFNANHILNLLGEIKDKVTLLMRINEYDKISLTL